MSRSTRSSPLIAIRRPLRRSGLAVAAASALLLAGCSGSSGGDGEATPTPTCDFTATDIPETCVPTNRPEDQPTTFPDDPNSIQPVTLPEVKFKLGGADNRADAKKTTATFTVVVKAGTHIGSEISCLGNGTVELTTVPDSKAYQMIDCNVDAELASDLITEDDEVLAKDTTFTVTVKSTKATRWDVAVFGCDKPVGTCQA